MLAVPLFTQKGQFQAEEGSARGEGKDRRAPFTFSSKSSMATSSGTACSWSRLMVVPFSLTQKVSQVAASFAFRLVWYSA